MKKIELLHFTVAKKMSVNCSTVSSSCHFFCHLLESGLARINWIRAVYQFRVEQLICCQKCRANDCRAIAFRAVHPHSLFSPQFWFQLVWNNLNLDPTKTKWKTRQRLQNFIWFIIKRRIKECFKSPSFGDSSLFPNK